MHPVTPRSADQMLHDFPCRCDRGGIVRYRLPIVRMPLRPLLRYPTPRRMPITAPETHDLLGHQQVQHTPSLNVLRHNFHPDGTYANSEEKSSHRSVWYWYDSK